MRPEITRRSALLGLGCLALAPLPAACRAGSALPRSLERSVQEALQGALEALRARQAEDGSFPSQVYGLLRTGESLTPFACSALDLLPPPLAARAAPVLARAHAWLLASLEASAGGLLGFAGPATDYPVYATALALRTLARAGFGDDPRVRRAAAALRGEQLRAEDGWADHPALGGFFMGGRERPVPPAAGHVDLSMTRRAAEALQALGAGPDDPALAAVRRFVASCRGEGGGFVYTPHERVLNKAGCDDAKDPPCRAYGSATADGILALLACGVPESAPEVGSALAFLRGGHRNDRNPGLDGALMEAFGPAMRGSYRAGAAAVFSRLGGPPGWRRPLVDAVLAEQRPDGTWADESPLQKEDDPLVATPFAVAALCRARRPDGGR